MRLTPGSRVDRYEIVEELGEGAYAETYLARDTVNGNLVVLKSPNPTLFADPSLFQRYRRESEIARSMDHPGVQRALDGGEHRTEPYLVLEYVDGRNLRAEIPAHSDTAATLCFFRSTHMSADILSMPALPAPYAGPCR